MNRLGIVLALAVASISSIACTAPSADDEQDGQKTEDVAQSKEELAINPVGGGGGGLTCHRFPDDTCVTVGSYCNRHGGQLWCDLAGNCTCRYEVQRTQVVGAAATDVGASSAIAR